MKNEEVKITGGSQISPVIYNDQRLKSEYQGKDATEIYGSRAETMNPFVQKQTMRARATSNDNLEVKFG